MALLIYDDLSRTDSREAILEFLESAYQAGAKRAGWDIKGLTIEDLHEAGRTTRNRLRA